MTLLSTIDTSGSRNSGLGGTRPSYPDPDIHDNRFVSPEIDGTPTVDSILPVTSGIALVRGNPETFSLAAKAFSVSLRLCGPLREREVLGDVWTYS